MRKSSLLFFACARQGHAVLSLASVVLMLTRAMAEMPYDFNDGVVPMEFHASGGSRLSASGRQSAEGKHSLRWDWRSRSALDIDVIGPPLQPKTHSAVQLWLYNLKPIPGRGMELGAGKNETVTSRALVNMDFRGCDNC